MQQVDVRHYLPPEERNNISRDSHINLIDREFAQQTEVVFLEGPEGRGRTHCLRQFALMHPETTVAVFLQCAVTAEWDFVRRDLYDQIAGMVAPSAEAARQISDKDLHAIVHELIRIRRKRKDPVYFVIDGLDELPEDQMFVRDLIMDALPINLANFKFLLSCNEGSGRPWIRSKRTKVFPALAFTFTESQEFLKGFLHVLELTKEIFSTSKGEPGHLATIRRILEGKNARDQTEIIRNLPDELPKLFDMEWASLDRNDPWLDKALAIVANRSTCSLKEIASFLSIDEAAVRQCLAAVRFVEIKDDSVAFVSDSFRHYAESRLRGIKKEVNERIIENLLRRPDDEVAFNTLPGFLAEAGRDEEVLRYLSRERVQVIVTAKQSCESIIQKAVYGIKSAQRLKNDGELLRLTALTTTLREYEHCDPITEEAEAYISLGNYPKALEIADGCRLRPHKLRVLAVIARKLSEAKQRIPPEIVAQIRATYAGMDPGTLQGCEMEVASDLLVVAPEIAEELVERSNRHSEKEARDAAFAQLSLFASLKGPDQGELGAALPLRFSEKIQTDEVKSLTHAAQILLGDFAVERVLAEIDRMATPKERLFLIRQWLQHNRENSQAWQVSEKGLDVLVSAADIAPNATMFADIAAPAAACGDIERRKKIVSSLDAQTGMMQKVGPSSEYVRFQLNLAAAEFSYAPQATVQRLLDTYYFADGLTDISTKLMAYVRLEEFLTVYKHIADAPAISKEGIAVLLRDEIEKSVAELLSSTADHHSIIAPVLKRIARYNPTRALEYAGRLNTPFRRELAQADVALSAVRGAAPGAEMAFEKVVHLLNMAGNWDDLIVESLHLLACSPNWKSEHGAVFATVEKAVDRIGSAEKRVHAYCMLLIIHGRKSGSLQAARKPDILSHLESTWEGIDQLWLQIKVAYMVASEIGAIEVDFARRLVEKAEALKAEAGLYHPDYLNTYMASVQLAIRVLGAILRGNPQAPIDAEWTGISDQISRIPSAGAQVQLWTQVAVRCELGKRKDLCARAVREKIRPAIDKISDKDRNFRNDVIADAAIALFLAHRETALQMVGPLPEYQRISVIDTIVKYIINKAVPGDPYDEKGPDHVVLEYEELHDLCTLAESTDEDRTIYRIVETIAEYAESKHGKQRLYASQRNDIFKRLTDIISKKLPSKRFAVHEGYRIICEAQASRIPSDKEMLDRCVQRTQRIPNVADRSFIYTIIAGIARNPAKATECWALARDAAMQIPVDTDRAEHCIGIVREAAGSSHEKVRSQCMQKALVDAFGNKGAQMEDIRRRVLDVLHTYEPEKRDELTAFLDLDPARVEKRTEIEARRRRLDARKELVSAEATFEDVVLTSEHAQAAWRVLGSLNARRSAPVSPEKVRSMLGRASSLSIQDSHAIMAWGIENLAYRSGNVEQTGQSLRRLFQACYTTAEIAHWLGANASKAIDARAVSAAAAGSIFVGTGGDGDATGFIEQWIKDEGGERFVICDPYFTEEDLRILLKFKAINPKCVIDVLTSKEGQKGSDRSYEEKYRDYWMVEVSDDEPCETRIVIAGIRPSGKAPIHDRWILGERAGLRLGTSLNSIGAIRLSEISKMDADAHLATIQTLQGFLETRIRLSANGDRIDYTTFTL